MGILEGMVAGAGEALQNVGLQGVAAAIQAERDARLSEIRLSEEATIRQRGKDDVAAERTAVAGIIGTVPTSKTVGVDDESGGHAVQQPMNAHEKDRATADALEKAGRTDAAKSYLERAERGEDRLYQRDTQAAAQRSNDEKWRATHAETVRFHNETLKRQSAQLGLKEKEAKDFEAAVDSYMTNKAQYEMLRAEKGNDPDLIAAAKQGMEADALKLKQYRVDVGDTSDFAKRLNLSATLTSLNKTIEDINADPATVAKAKAARDSVIEQMAALTSVKGEAAGTPQDVRVGGKVIGQATTQAEADALVAAHKKKGPAAAAAKPAANAGLIETPAPAAVETGEWELVSKRGGRGGVQYVIKQRGKPNAVAFQRTVSEAEAKRLGVI